MCVETVHQTNYIGQGKHGHTRVNQWCYMVVVDRLISIMTKLNSKLSNLYYYLLL